MSALTKRPLARSHTTAEQFEKSNSAQRNDPRQLQCTKLKRTLHWLDVVATQSWSAVVLVVAAARAKQIATLLALDRGGLVALVRLALMNPK